MLYRAGSKRRLLERLFKLFPRNKSTFIDLFMGSGVVTNQACKLYKNVISNDIDNEVYNLFVTLQNNRQELYDRIAEIPHHETVINVWCRQAPADNIDKACKFLVSCNYTFMSFQSTLHFRVNNHLKDVLLKSIKTFVNSTNIMFMNKPYTEVLKSISIRTDKNENRHVFVYADPPYVDTNNMQMYKLNWYPEDLNNLLSLLKQRTLDFALSETDKCLKYIDLTGLHVTEINEIRHLQKRATEILITNYKTKTELF